MKRLDVFTTAMALVFAIVLLSGLSDHSATESSYWAHLIPGVIANAYVAVRITATRPKGRE